MFLAWDAVDSTSLSAHALRFALCSAKIDSAGLDGAENDLPILEGIGLLSGSERGGSKLRKTVIDLYDSTRGGLFAYLISLGLDRNQAEDVIHDAFLKLIQHLLNKKDDRNLRGWVFRVAHNLAVNLHQSAQNRLFESVGNDEPSLLNLVDKSLSPEELVIRKEEQRRVQASMHRLTQQQRYAVLLRAEGLRYHEISAVLGISLQRVAELVQRALAHLSGDLL